jgi:3,4-dihydroxy 2-butanone 4-phosphate synthase/GTP cyclohydrolase II
MDAPPDLIEALLPGDPREDRPFVSLTYAQSLDGSITVRRGEPLALSGPASMRLTHRLRARHQAILVGIGTVLADDPQLTVRLVPGPSPRPVVLDSALRTPSKARLLAGGRRPIVATTLTGSAAQETILSDLGVEVVRLPATETGRIALAPLLAHLRAEGITQLMVEGGAEVITAFLRERLVDRVVLTIAPVLVGGLNAVKQLPDLPRLQSPRAHQLGPDIIVWGDLPSRR